MSKETPSEETPNPTPATPPQGNEAETPAPQAPDDPEAPAQEIDWKAEARKWEARAKADAGAAAKLAEIEEASKTEAQKQADALAAAQAKVTEYETREQIATWKAEVSTETGVPAVALAGATKEEIEAHAETLKPLIGSAEQNAETPRPGVVPTIGKTPATPANIPITSQISAAEQTRDATTPGSPEWKAAQERVMELKGMQLFDAHKTVT